MGDKVLSGLKPRLRALEGIEKTRIALSSDDTAQLTLDELVDGEDVERDLELDAFNGLIAPLTDQLAQLLD